MGHIPPDMFSQLYRSIYQWNRYHDSNNYFSDYKKKKVEVNQSLLFKILFLPVVFHFIYPLHMLVPADVFFVAGMRCPVLSHRFGRRSDAFG